MMSAFSAISTRDAPWSVVPAHDKEIARLFVPRIIVKTLAGNIMSFPKTDAKQSVGRNCSHYENGLAK